MKLKAPIVFVALLCCCLMLISGLAPAQNKNASTRKPKAAPAKKGAPTSTPPPTPTLAGSYTLIDPAGASARVTRAIEYAVDGMWREDEARRKLTETNLPPPQEITIWYSERDFSIKTDQTGLIQTPPDGRSEKWTSKYRVTYDVSTKWVNGNLERTFSYSKGKRVNTYSLGSDGKMLIMNVTANSAGWWHRVPPFKHPLNYQLEYRRN